MGADCICVNQNKSNEDKKDLAPGEEEISFQSFSSISDKTFSKLEYKYNFLTSIPLADYLLLLKDYTIDTGTLVKQNLELPDRFSSEDEFFTQSIDYDLFQSFIENQLLKHPSIYVRASTNSTETNAFKETLIEIAKNLKSKLNQYYSIKEPNRIKKSHLILFGLLYCNSRNVAKVKLFFDLFSKDNAMSPSNQLNDFLISMFILVSYGFLAAIRKIGKQYEIIGEIPDEEIKKCMNASELKDSINLLEIFNETFFKNKQNLSYDEVKDLFQNQHFGWLFNPKGIRYMLEKNNV